MPSNICQNCISLKQGTYGTICRSLAIIVDPSFSCAYYLPLPPPTTNPSQSTITDMLSELTGKGPAGREGPGREGQGTGGEGAK